MTPLETLTISRFVRACCPQQKFDEYTPDAWHKLLGDLAYPDVEAAVNTLGKRLTFISPAEIREEVRRIRNERVSRPAEDIDYDPADVLGGIQAIRTGRSRVADGTVRERPVAALVQATLERLPKIPSVVGGFPKPEKERSNEK